MNDELKQIRKQITKVLENWHSDPKVANKKLIALQREIREKGLCEVRRSITKD